MCLSKLGALPPTPSESAESNASNGHEHENDIAMMDTLSKGDGGNTPRSSPPSSLSSRTPPAPPLPPSAAVLAAASPLTPPPSASRPGLPAPPSPPPSLVPSSLSMVSMASMLGAHPPPFLMSPAALGGYPGGRDIDFVHKFMAERGGPLNVSPPPPPQQITAPTNDPTANECKIVEYRGEKIASFIIGGRTMLCLPQAFELFLKHLVGGLHTVYTKLKRLEITPIVCNVEQVRILRGLGAIQPGVNRCKLLADGDFDTLYKDCTTSRYQMLPNGSIPSSFSAIWTPHFLSQGGGRAIKSHGSFHL